MSHRLSITLVLLVSFVLGCGSSENTATPPAGPILTEAQIKEQDLEVKEETFGRTIEGEEPKK